MYFFLCVSHIILSVTQSPQPRRSGSVLADSGLVCLITVTRSTTRLSPDPLAAPHSPNRAAIATWARKASPTPLLYYCTGSPVMVRVPVPPSGRRCNALE